MLRAFATLLLALASLVLAPPAEGGVAASQDVHAQQGTGMVGSVPGYLERQRLLEERDSLSVPVELLVADAKVVHARKGKRVVGAERGFHRRQSVRAKLEGLGVPAIRIDVVPHKPQTGSFLPLAVDVLTKITRATEATGVNFAIENHGSVTNRPEFLAELFERVGSKRLGLTLDTANFYWFGHPLSRLYKIFEQFADRVFHTHTKSIRYPESEREKQRPIGWKYEQYTCPVYDGDIDFGRIVGILKKAGYSNDLCLEDESLGKFPAARRAEVLVKEVRHLRSVA